MPVIVRKIDPHVTIFTVPYIGSTSSSLTTPGADKSSPRFMRFGLIPVGGRSTAITMANGNVVLFASHGNDEATQNTLRDLHGPNQSVSHIVALDAVHQLYLSDYIKSYPNAKLVGPKGLVKKRSDLKFDLILPDTGLDKEMQAEFDAIPMAGHPNEDIIFHHRPSRTLIQADVLFNLPDPDQTPKWSFIPSFMLRRLTPYTGFHKFVLKAFSKPDPSGFAQAARRVSALDFVRIIPCHGAVIDGSTTGKSAKDAWDTAFSKILSTKNE
ncbi:hypothetical protein EMMF5_000232 [Cystobasidiomycetes sp. EMM_F5]